MMKIQAGRPANAVGVFVGDWVLVVLSTLLAYGVGILSQQRGAPMGIALAVGLAAGAVLMIGSPYALSLLDLRRREAHKPVLDALHAGPSLVYARSLRRDLSGMIAPTEALWRAQHMPIVHLEEETADAETALETALAMLLIDRGWQRGEIDDLRRLKTNTLRRVLDGALSKTSAEAELREHASLIYEELLKIEEEQQRWGAEHPSSGERGAATP